MHLKVVEEEPWVGPGHGESKLQVDRVLQLSDVVEAEDLHAERHRGQRGALHLTRGEVLRRT